MEERYKMELGSKKPSELTELVLDHCNAEKIVGLGDNLTSLKFLSIMNCGLSTLDGMPHLPVLEALDISSNSLSCGLDILVKCCPKLQKLTMSMNEFADFESLEPLKDLKELDSVDIDGNEAENTTENLRSKIFGLVPTLKSMNGYDADGKRVRDYGDDEDDDDLDDEDLSGEEDAEDSEGDEDDGPGLSYLDSSDILEDEDETEDFEDEEVEGEKPAPSAGAERPIRRALKRKHDGTDDGDK